jgi:predicted Zn-dependent peptidase
MKEKTTIWEYNGLRCVLIENTGCGIVSAQLVNTVGSLHEKDTYAPGTEHFLEHMICRGTKSFPSPEYILNTIDILGGYKNAMTGFDILYIPTTFLLEHANIYLSYIVEQFFAPIIPEELFESEKKTIIEESKKVHSDMNKKVYYAKKYLYKNRRADIFSIGSPEDIEKISYQEIKKFHKEFFIPENAFLIITGDITQGGVQEILSKISFEASGKNTFDKNANEAVSTGEIFETKVIGRTALHFAYTIPKVGEEHFSEANFLFSLLTMSYGPLSRKLRSEKSMTYGFSLERINGVAIITAETKQENEQEFISLMKSSLEELVKNSIDPLDFKRLVTKNIFRKKIRNMNPELIAAYYREKYMDYKELKTLEEFDALSEKISIENVQKYLELLVLQKPTIIFVR